MLQDLLLKNDHYIFVLSIDKASLQLHDIAENKAIIPAHIIHVHNNIIFNVYKVAQLLKSYCSQYTIVNPLLLISAPSHTELLCDSTYILDEYPHLVHKATIIPSCLKIYVSLLQPEVIFQYHLLTSLAGITENIITSSTALSLHFLHTLGKVPPENCMNVLDLHAWIEENSITDKSTLFTAMQKLGHHHGNH